MGRYAKDSMETKKLIAFDIVSNQCITSCDDFRMGRGGFGNSLGVRI